jgi:hypothetical protein
VPVAAWAGNKGERKIGHFCSPCNSCRSFRRSSARQSHELRETKYMMYVVDAADPFRSIRQPLQVEKMGN